jgi:hypothetical protein
MSTETEDIRTLATMQNLGLEQLRTVWPRLYFAKKYHRTTRDEPLTFLDRPWLLDIYADHSPKIVIRKCSQVGITEYALCTMFSLAEEGYRGMYLLPDDEWRQTFVTDRIDGLLNRCPAYKIAVTSYLEDGKEADNRRIKNIFGSAWRFAGTNAKTSGSRASDIKKPKSAFEFQASVLMFDEYDEHEQANLSYFYDRLQDEKNPLIFLFGNPTISGMGIDAEFQKSDQKYWYVYCEHCGHDQVLDWYLHFVIENAPGSYQLRDPVGHNPICEKCGSPFNRLGRGEWKKCNPGSATSGYTLSRLFIYKRPTDISELWAKFMDSLTHPMKAQNFHNNYLGLPYENTRVKLTDPVLERAAVDLPSVHMFHIGGQVILVAGIDQGADFTISISELIDSVRHSRFLGLAKTWDEVEQILTEFSVGPCVVDAQGGGYHETREFVLKALGDRWMCYYNLNDQVSRIYLEDYETGVIRCNRTEILDAGVDQFKRGLVKHPKDWASLLDGAYRKHLLGPVRLIDPKGKPIWTKPGDGADHFFHARVGYETLATMVSGLENSYRKARSWAV